MSIEDDFAAFRRVAGEELDKLREENAALRQDYLQMGQTALKSEINHYIGSIIMTDEQRKL